MSTRRVNQNSSLKLLAANPKQWKMLNESAEPEETAELAIILRGLVIRSTLNRRLILYTFQKGCSFKPVMTHGAESIPQTHTSHGSCQLRELLNTYLYLTSTNVPPFDPRRSPKARLGSERTMTFSSVIAVRIMLLERREKVKKVVDMKDLRQQVS